MGFLRRQVAVEPLHYFAFWVLYVMMTPFDPCFEFL